MAQQSYPGLSRIADGATRETVRILFDRVAALEGTRTGSLQMGNHRVSGVGDPVADGDVVTLGYLNETLSATAIRQALLAGGDAPLNVTSLRGFLADPQKMGIRVHPDAETSLPDILTALPYEVLTWKGLLYYFDPSQTNPGKWVVLSTAAVILVDTHANRLLTYGPTQYPAGLLFWESDRTVLYMTTGATAATRVWTYLLGTMRGTLPTDTTTTGDQRPIDLGVNDTNFRFEGTNLTEYYRWDGSAFVLLPDLALKANLVRNGSFEWYETWAATIANPTYWTVTAASANRATSGQYGTYECALTNTGGSAASLVQDVIPTISGTENVRWRGRSVTLVAIVTTGTGGRASISIDDGIGTSTSPTATGTGVPQQLVVTRTINGAATRIRVSCDIASGAAIQANFDEVQLVDGIIPPRAFAPHAIDVARGYPYRCRVTNSSNQSINDATDTTLTWDTEEIDKGSLHSTVTNPTRVTIPTGEAGEPSIWRVEGQVNWAADATGDRVIWIRRNGATVVGYASCKSPTSVPENALMQVQYTAFDHASGDYFELLVTQDSGGVLDVNSDATYLAMYRIFP